MRNRGVSNKIRRIVLSDVKIYTGDDCINCHKAKDFFRENEIDFIECNISKDASFRKELMLKKIMSVPYIIINDKEFIGFTNKTKAEMYKELYK